MPEQVVDDLVAVTREALTNVARHAQAEHADVLLTATSGEICLVVSDDGIGVRDGQRRSGLANLHERAARLGGKFEITGRPAGGDQPPAREGTQLRWTIPLTRWPPCADLARLPHIGATRRTLRSCVWSTRSVEVDVGIGTRSLTGAR